MNDLVAFLAARLDDLQATAVTDLRLRDVEADRAILALLERDVVDGRERDYDATEVLEQVVRIRAARFSDHPDYRQEWAP